MSAKLTKDEKQDLALHTPSKELLYRGALSTQTSARLAGAIMGAIMREFGRTDGLVVLDWLIARMQATAAADNLFVPRKKIRTKGKRK